MKGRRVCKLFGKNVCFFTALLFSLVLVACAARETAMPLPTASPVAIASPTRTSTAVPLPSITPTVTRTATPVWIPLPTLAPEQAEEAIMELLRTNGNCRLPCWFGVVPGVTTWSEARRIFEPFATIEDNWRTKVMVQGEYQILSDHSVIFQVPGEERESGGSISDQGGIVATIFVGPNAARNGGFVFSRLLSEYGKPDQVHLDIVAHVPEPGIPFDLILYYPEQNILLYYQLEGDNDGGSLCVDLKGASPRMFFWSDESNWEVPYDELPLWAAFGDRFPVEIEKVTDYSVESFYETFKDPNASQILCSDVSHWE